MEFVIVVGKTAAGQTEAKIGVRPQQPDKARFRIQINRRHRQAQRDVGVEEIRLVQIVIAVTVNRRGPLHGLVAAQLNQLPPLRINLPESGAIHQQASHDQKQHSVFSHPCLYIKSLRRARGVPHGWLMKNPTYPFCSRPGRAAARPEGLGRLHEPAGRSGGHLSLDIFPNRIILPA